MKGIPKEVGNILIKIICLARLQLASYTFICLPQLLLFCLQLVPVGTIDRDGGPNDAFFLPQHEIFSGERICDHPNGLSKW